MRIGADYYPEHWKKERWTQDLEMMHAAGLKVVRIGEFDWSLYEPSEGDYRFDWMDEILDFMADHDMKVVLGTPSATPPKWMCDKYGDELYQQDIRGNSKVFGTRKHYCFNSEVYRKENEVLVTKIAERYGKHPAVEGWQIDNEIGWANTTRCYCEKCRKKFTAYLEKKYKTIDALNEAYGTVFWSETYNDFSQVIVPRVGVCYDSDPKTQGQNPGLRLDFDRFSSDSAIEFMKHQADIIRTYSSYPITTNMLDADVNSNTGIDYFKMSRELDYVTWDNYIEFQWGKASDHVVSANHALIRSYKHQPFWVMEEQAGPCGWSTLGPAPTPGKLRLWTYQSVANGADTVVFFRWRSCLFGTEEYWHGILEHDGKPGRRYAEVSKIGAEMKVLSEKFGALMPKAKVAVLKSFDSEWSHSVHSHVEGFRYDTLLMDYYRAFYDLGVSVEFAAPEEDLSDYSIVLAPALIMVSAEQKKNLEQYAANGGTLLVSFRSGVKNMENAMLEATVPGDFAELTGIEVEEYDPQFQKQTPAAGVFGAGTADLWCDIIDPKDTEVLGVYTGDYYAGKPCLTRNRRGEGTVYYLGCDLDHAAMDRLAEYLCKEEGISCSYTHQEGVEQVLATDGEKGALFVMNHNAHTVVVPLEKSGIDAMTGKPFGRQVTLEPYGVAVVEEQ